MTSVEIVFGALLVLVMLAVAVYFTWRQRVAARSLPALEDEDTRLYVRRQIRRRLLSSAMLVVLALMLVGWWLLESTLTLEADAAKVQAAQQRVAEIFIYYWGAFLLVLLTVLLLAALDLLANARFGIRQQRKLENDRHLMLHEEAAKLRRDR